MSNSEIVKTSYQYRQHKQSIVVGLWASAIILICGLVFLLMLSGGHAIVASFILLELILTTIFFIIRPIQWMKKIVVEASHSQFAVASVKHIHVKYELESLFYYQFLEMEIDDRYRGLFSVQAPFRYVGYKEKPMYVFDDSLIGKKFLIMYDKEKNKGLIITEEK